MICGNIGSATLRRLDYTVIGDSVNIAQRLQSAADANQIVISANCYEKVKQSFNCREIGLASLKNKSTEMVLYEVLN